MDETKLKALADAVVSARRDVEHFEKNLVEAKHKLRHASDTVDHAGKALELHREILAEARVAMDEELAAG